MGTKIKLIPGEYYILKHTGEFCHCMGNKGALNFSKRMNECDRIKAQYIGLVDTEQGKRAVFHNPEDSKRRYIMFSIDKTKYIVSHVQDDRK